jgi:phosphatidylglycerophosphate synthase
MALEKLRRRWETALGPLMNIASNVSPITVTWLALPFGVAGGLLAMYAPDDSAGGWWMLGAALMIGFAMIFDGLDGSLARAKGQVTRWGDYLDHTIDRILDSTWVVCISASVFVNDLALGFAAALLTLLGSYMGTQAQAVAGTRNYRGFSRADRTVLTLLSLVIMGGMLLMGITTSTMYPAPFDHIAVNPLSLIVFISALGGIWTFLVRFKQAQGDIQAIDAEDPLPQPNAKKQDESSENR